MHSSLNLSAVIESDQCLDYFEEHYRKTANKLMARELAPNFAEEKSHIYAIYLGEERDCKFFCRYLNYKKIEYYTYPA